LSFNGNGAVFPFEGNYTSYQSYLSTIESEGSPSAEKKVSAGSNDWAEQKRKKQEERRKKSRIEKIEGEIIKAEERMSEIDRLVLTLSTDYVALQELYTEREELENLCNRLMEEWSELEN
jgi:ATP-binding cassette subfamily F protein 3